MLVVRVCVRMRVRVRVCVCVCVCVCVYGAFKGYATFSWYVSDDAGDDENGPVTRLSLSDCGLSGRSGPSAGSCTDIYSPKMIEAFALSITKFGFQKFTAPSKGIYMVEAYGAQGGSGKKSSSGGDECSYSIESTGADPMPGGLGAISYVTYLPFTGRVFLIYVPRRSA